MWPETEDGSRPTKEQGNWTHRSQLQSEVMSTIGLITNIMAAVIRLFALKNDVQRYEILAAP